MHRFYIESSAAPRIEKGGRVNLPDDIAHQIRNVLRLRASERIALFTGDGHEWVAELVATPNRRGARVRLLDVTEPDVEMKTEVAMLMALTRPQRYELALAKCTELGAAEFRPVTSERVLRSEAQVGAARMQRWNRIVREAAELSGRVRVPQITEPLPLSDAISDALSEGASVIVLWEGATDPMFTDQLQRIQEQTDRPRRLALVLGPVGGFADEEAHEAIGLGAAVASLGPRILRTETAAIAVMSLAAQILR